LRNALSRAARSVVGAVAFLTVLPIPRVRLDEGDVGRGVVFFPLVGALVGAAVAFVGVALDDVLTPFIAAGAGLTVAVAASGAIHLDGLADTADGLAGRTRERALEIMREGTIGAFGATALALNLLLQVGAVAALLTAGDAVSTVAAAFALGRAAPLGVSWALPYARPGQGSGRILTDAASRLLLAVGLALACGLAVALVGAGALALVAGALAATLIVAVVAKWRLGGATGDVFGATIELATTGSLLAAVAVS
jgi:adenosylcobinamide-GDP ribazoletransferase